ncbi:unnamed protein product [Nesidiocoris tenuis]|uniref:Uncharacterized protein n=1 Tax=Nesidiocoris tenuis TaxID=355587 RepID=A0A6H5HPS7_9HEMI|nr:unnamed protein product [Nesidiocoris tenuis]
MVESLHGVAQMSRDSLERKLILFQRIEVVSLPYLRWDQEPGAFHTAPKDATRGTIIRISGIGKLLVPDPTVNNRGYRPLSSY